MKIEKILTIFSLVTTILDALKNFLSASKKSSSEGSKDPEENS